MQGSLLNPDPEVNFSLKEKWAKNDLYYMIVITKKLKYFFYVNLLLRGVNFPFRSFTFGENYFTYFFLILSEIRRWRNQSNQFSDTYIFATWCCKPLIIQSLSFLSSRIQSYKYQKASTSEVRIFVLLILGSSITHLCSFSKSKFNLYEAESLTA